MNKIPASKATHLVTLRTDLDDTVVDPEHGPIRDTPVLLSADWTRAYRAHEWDDLAAEPAIARDEHVTDPRVLANLNKAWTYEAHPVFANFTAMDGAALPLPKPDTQESL